MDADGCDLLFVMLVEPLLLCVDEINHAYTIYEVHQSFAAVLMRLYIRDETLFGIEELAFEMDWERFRLGLP